MGSPRIADDASVIVADVLREHLSVPVEHLPQGTMPQAPAVPTLRVRPLMAPPPKYSRVGGWHAVTVQALSVNPVDSESLLDLLPKVHRGDQLVGDNGVIIALDRQQQSRSITAGVMTHTVRVKAIVAERSPALQGLPFQERLRAETKRLTARTGALEMIDTLHGTDVTERGNATTTLTGSLLFRKVPLDSVQRSVKDRLSDQVGWSVEAVGNVQSVSVDDAVAVDQSVVKVPVKVIYRARLEAA